MTDNSNWSSPFILSTSCCVSSLLFTILDWTSRDKRANTHNTTKGILEYKSVNGLSKDNKKRLDIERDAHAKTIDGKEWDSLEKNKQQRHEVSTRDTRLNDRQERNKKKTNRSHSTSILKMTSSSSSDSRHSFSLRHHRDCLPQFACTVCMRLEASAGGNCRDWKQRGTYEAGTCIVQTEEEGIHSSCKDLPKKENQIPNKARRDHLNRLRNEEEKRDCFFGRKIWSLLFLISASIRLLWRLNDEGKTWRTDQVFLKTLYGHRFFVS